MRQGGRATGQACSYTAPPWRRLRARFLRSNPLCIGCLRAGRTTVANTVDHIVPHRGDVGRFFDESNLQALCSTCHYGDKQRADKGGPSLYRGCGLDGQPLDPGHHWRGA